MPRPYPAIALDESAALCRGEACAHLHAA